MNAIVTASAWPLDRASWNELAPMVARIARIDPSVPIRLIHLAGGRRAALAKLPSGALVSRTVRTVHVPTPGGGDVTAPAGGDVTAPAGGDVTAPGGGDVTARSGDLWRWLDDVQAAPPERVDASWRGGRPPESGWQEIERVPDAVVRDLVRHGAQAHTDAASQGLGARAADALLDTAVLTVTGGRRTVGVTNRSLSALVSMGFMPAGSVVVVAVSRGWTRVAAEFGNAYAEPTVTGLVLV